MVRAADDVPVDFNRDIRPILAGKCYLCHGPDAAERVTEMRLDTQAGAVADLGGYAAIVPGDAAQSELMRRVTSSDPEERMPPPDAGEPLAAEAQALLRRWIDDGADFQQYWSFSPPVQAPPPEVSNPDWPRNAVDHFVLARLDGEGLPPSAPADRYTLIRRVALALTGLPPTPEEVDQFVGDQTDDAYERMVDRYLHGTAYGERWAAVWLDLARYADSAGYAQDPLRTIWPYRDWVIRAINGNMSFEQFTIEQIAGDLLPEATDDQRIATGFHRNTMTNSEGGTDDEEFRNVAVVDRVNTTMQVWMGVTMGCAQCHTHKFDPITQEEYYRFFAILNNTADADQGDESPTLPVWTEELKSNQAELRQQIDELRRKIAQQDNERREHSLAHLAGTLHTRYVRVELPGEKKLLSLAEVQVLAAGKNVALDGRPRQSSTAYEGAAELAVDGNTDGHYFDARSTTHTEEENDPWWEADLGDELAVDEIVLWNRTDGGLFTRLAGCRVVLLDGQRRPLSVHVLQSAPEINANWKPPTAADQLTADDRDRIAAYASAAADEDDPERAKLKELEKKLADVKPYTTPVMQELTGDKRRATHIHERGNFLSKGAEVEPGVPAAFHRLPDGVDPSRMALARWLVDRRNPLTARVVVNRYWEQLFGRGLVETSEDFGSQGVLPTHPELLDWLAVEFMERDWDVRWLLRYMVTSATYRQSSDASGERIARDRDNRLLARGPRFRLSAEMVRDQALAVAGLLSHKMYGPPVQPPRPKLGLNSAFGGSTDWETSPGEDRYRRGVYTMWRRTTPYPSMTTFDAPSREFCSIRRIRTNTPLQALVTLNDPVYVEAAQSLARRVARDGGPSAEDRADYALRLCLSRPAKPAELESLVELHAAAKTQLSDKPEDARRLATEPLGPPAEGEDVVELAAWTVVANVLMNLDEFLTRP